ncbi:chemotaxis protein CheW [Chromobacterium alticapitis]|uniref:Chemotaxis protein CheW n=1 Tax=Chromobacterium alticapitis TaxID=2073169 RepID=A0A2S5DGH2_9NEIS|nr:chemotaxis protein CheW [Chromobacterium alticapitis]POZ62119.1 chemotaxis protein CheW [Chromobacterium alticapitis]
MAALNMLRRSDGAPAGDEPDETRQFLTFQLSGETFAVSILRIREILEYMAPTTVPLMPSFIRGVMNLRGAVVPVIDLSLRFAREETAIQRRTCIVIIEMEHAEQCQLLGVLVDAVHEVLAIADSEIEPPPQFGSKIRVDFIEGMAKVEGRFVVLLNVDKVLSLEEMSLLSELGHQETAGEEG